MRHLREYCDAVNRDGFTKEEATAMLEEGTNEIALEHHWPLAKARDALRHDIGYFAGYYDHATADRVYEMYDTDHPVFGRTHPTPAVAFRMGLEMGSVEFKN
jgi:hypothetical protein